MDRNTLAAAIAASIQRRVEPLREAFRSHDIPSVIVDDLLDEPTARHIGESFPDLAAMTHNATLRERKSIGVTMDAYPPAIDAITFAFQDPAVIRAIAAITAIDGLEGDPELYAGGISSMVEGNFLNPHIDNSHDLHQQRYRVLNLLYYVSPGWCRGDGGHLELWDDGVDHAQRIIECRFNRLVIMATNRSSWHSVSPVTGSGRRNCVSNYYFAAQPIEGEDYHHVTTFRARPGQTLRDYVLQIDGIARNGLRKVFRRGLRPTKHVYQPK
ncbi:MAG: 2OG-Fe(II) oxygenase [Planctomycetota bacterium]